MAVHKLQLTLTLDDAQPDAATLAVTHRVTSTLAGHAVSHSEPVVLDDEDAAKAALRQLLEANRAAVEAAATPLVVNHVAAVMNRPQKGVKRVGLGGSLGAVGGAAVEKKD